MASRLFAFMQDLEERERQARELAQKLKRAQEDDQAATEQVQVAESAARELKKELIQAHADLTAGSLWTLF